MKKIYAFIICIIPLIAFAQPTITQSALPFDGLAFTMGTDGGYYAAITAGGANQTWDYSSLNNAVQDTTAFFTSVGTLYQSYYPSSNLSTHNPIDTTWGYFHTDSTGFYVDGLTGPGLPGLGMVHLIPPGLFAPVPFNYMDTIDNDARIVVDTSVTIFLSTYQAKAVRNIYSHFDADGWGTLILPTATYPNVLRERITEITWDSAYYDPSGTGVFVAVPSFLYTPTVTQRTIYRWVQDQQPSYLLGLTADSLGDTAHYSEYMINYLILSNNTVISDHSAIQPYPNPANRFVHLNNDLNSDATFIIRNLLGEEIEKRTVSNEKIITVDVEKYANGFYQFSLSSDKENRNGKFIVQH